MARIATSVSAHQVSRIREWLPKALLHPVFLLVVAGLVHVVGRTSAVSALSRFDSFVYSVAAWKFYDPQATAADLVPDKPAGQAFLTGWLYRLAPDPPTRLTLMPLDSAFLAAGYLLFWLVARRLADRTSAAAGTLLLVLGINIYNTLYEDVAGLHVNEVYLLAPMLLAVWAHLALQGAAWRGLFRGLGLGLALTVKQSAAGLLLVLVIHGLVRAAAAGRLRSVWQGVGWSMAGVAVAWLPLVVFLYVRGWLGPHLGDLADSSARFVEFSWPGGWHGYRFVPVAAAAWWVIVGLVLGRSAGGSVALPDRGVSLEREAARLAWLWLLVEVLILWLMIRRSGHYHQQVVPPLALLAVIGMARLSRMMACMPVRQRLRTRYLAMGVSLALWLVAVMPFAAETRRRLPSFDYEDEVRTFAAWLADWSPRTLASPRE